MDQWLPNLSLKVLVCTGIGPWSPLFFSDRERKTHEHKQICGIVPGLGGCQKFVYVFFFRVISYVGEKNA